MGFNTVRRLAVEIFYNGTGIGCELSHPLAVIAHVVTGRNGARCASGSPHCADSSGGVLCRPVKEGNVHGSILSSVGVLKSLLRHGRFDRLILTSFRFSFTRSRLLVFRGALFGGVLLIGTSLNIILNDGRIGLLTVIGILRVFCGVVDQIAVARTSLSNLRRVRNTFENDRIAAAIRIRRIHGCGKHSDHHHQRQQHCNNATHLLVFHGIFCLLSMKLFRENQPSYIYPFLIIANSKRIM